MAGNKSLQFVHISESCIVYMVLSGLIMKYHGRCSLHSLYHTGRNVSRISVFRTLQKNRANIPPTAAAERRKGVCMINHRQPPAVCLRLTDADDTEKAPATSGSFYISVILLLAAQLSELRVPPFSAIRSSKQKTIPRRSR